MRQELTQIAKETGAKLKSAQIVDHTDGASVSEHNNFFTISVLILSQISRTFLEVSSPLQINAIMMCH